MKSVILFLFSFNLLAGYNYSTDLKKKCIDGSVLHCKRYGEVKSQKNDFLQTLWGFKRACELKDGLSCYTVARLYRKFKLKLKDNNFLNKACSLDYKQGCVDLALMSYREKRIHEAIGFYNKACVLNDEEACQMSETTLSNMYRIIKLDESLLSVSEREYKEIFLKELTLRKESLITQCAAKNGLDCRQLAEFYYQIGDFKNALSAGEVACSKGFAKGCLYKGFAEQDLKLDPDNSFDRACRFLNAEGCHVYAEKLKSVEISKAITFFRRACEIDSKKYWKDCLLYAKYHQQNPKRAKKYSDLACSLEIEEACQFSKVLASKIIQHR